MKSVLLSLLLACTHLLIAQNPPGTAVVTGTMTGLTDSLISLQDATPFASARPIVEARIDPTGTFWLEWELSSPELVYLTYGDQRLPLFLRPGEKIVLQMQGNRLQKSVQLTEATLSMADHQALMQYHRKVEDLISLQAQLSEAPSLPAYMRTVRAYERKANDAWQGLRENVTQSKPFVAYMDSRVEHVVQALTLRGPIEFAERNGQDPRRLELPPNLIPPPSPAQLNRPELLNSPEYQLFVSAYMDYLFALNRVSTPHPEHTDLWFQLLSENLQAEVLTYGVAGVLEKVFLSSYPDAAESYYMDFPQLPGAEEYLPYLKELHQARIKLIPGAEPPQFSLTNEKGQLQRLVDLLGKGVYLIFWQEEEANSNGFWKGIEALCTRYVDQEFVVWTIGVGTQQELPSSLRCPNVISHRISTTPNELTEAFGLVEFPAYVLIGRDGSIAASAAPSPASPLLDSLLQAVLEGN